MRARVWAACLLMLGLSLSLPVPGGAARSWRQVHPHWREAYVLSFRSPDLLGNAPDERWGERDDRLVCGGILSDFPDWLDEHAADLDAAREEGRPILLSLHVHSGFGTGLVTYSDDLKRAEVANYPWLIRCLQERGLDGPDVTVAVDTCNAQATAAHQIRRDLVPGGVRSWSAFQAWLRADAGRMRLPLAEAYRVFAQDRVRTQLAGAARRSRSSVRAVPLVPLSPDERADFRGRLFGPRGVIVATPAFFNLLRLGPRPRGTQTADLLHDRLETRVLDGLLSENRREFHRFTEYAFLEAAGVDPELVAVEDAPAPPTRAVRGASDPRTPMRGD